METEVKVMDLMSANGAEKTETGTGVCVWGGGVTVYVRWDYLT